MSEHDELTRWPCQDLHGGRVEFVNVDENGTCQHPECHPSNKEPPMSDVRELLEKATPRPTEADLDWMEQAIQRHTEGFNAWWAEFVQQVSGRDAMRAIIGIWQGGEANTYDRRDALLRKAEMALSIAEMRLSSSLNDEDRKSARKTIKPVLTAINQEIGETPSDSQE